MRKKHVSLARAFLAFLMLITSLADVHGDSAYQVGPGDELSVNFPLQGNLGDLSKLSGNSLSIQIVGDSIYWHHQVLVAPDGFISLPSLPPLNVAGATLEAIQKMITDHLNEPVRKSLVSVILLKPNSTAFYVWGEVKQPGRFVLERPTQLLEAIGTAGGATDHARLKHVLLMRPGRPSVSLDLSRKNIEKNGPPDILVQSADTILIPRKLTPDSTAVFLFLSALSAATGVYIASKQ